VPRAFAEMRPLQQEVFRNYSFINFVFFRYSDSDSVPVEHTVTVSLSHMP